MSTSGNSSVCQPSYKNSNSTLILYDAYNGIPGTLVVNAIAFVGLLLVFTLLRKIAWDYGRLALVSRTEENDTISGQPSYNVWTSLFYGDQDKRSLGSQESLDTVVNSQDKGVYRWIVAFVKLKDIDILHKCGRDALQYLSFQRYLIVYVSIITIISIGVILPINFQGSLLGNATEFGHTTIGNLDSNSPLLWVHSVFSVLYLGIMVFVLHHFHANLDVEEDEQVSRTLMIHNIPKNKCFVDSINLHFTEAYPEVVVCDIQFAYNITDLVHMDNRRKRAAEGRMYSEMEMRKSGQRPTMYPYVCGQLCCSACCGCKQVDAINIYMEEEAELMRLCEEERETAYRDPIGIAFITLQSEMQAQRIRADFRANCKGTHNPQMSSVYGELHVQDWQVHFAPAPENIYWENLSVPDWKWWTRAICINGLLIIIFFFLTTPIMFLHMLDYLNIDINKPGETLHSPLLVQFLPTLLLWTFSALAPNIIYYSDQFIGHWTRTAEHHAVMRKTYIFLLLMVLILPSLGLTSAKALFEWAVVNHEKKMQWECIFLPSNGSFFVNYVITAALIGTALELLRFTELFMYGLKLMMARSSAEKATVQKSVLWDFQFGAQYAWMLCIFTIIVCYSIPCPLVTPFGLVYLALKHMVDRYNIFFAYKSSKINRHIHSSAVTFVLWSVIMLQMSVTFFAGLRAEGFDRVFLFSGVMLFLTLIMFVGRLSFGWFKYIKPNRYRQFEDGEITSPDTDRSQTPFVARVLMEQPEVNGPLEYSSSRQPTLTSYGSTEEARVSMQPSNTDNTT